MRVKFVFTNGTDVEIGDDDWIGAIAYHGLLDNLVWMESCSDKKALVKALNAGMKLYLNRGVREFNIDSRVVVEAKVIEDGKETMLWKRGGQ